MNIVKASEQSRDQIINLLQSEKLPSQDLPYALDNFFVVTHGDMAIAAIGLEQYHNCGLLRSMVVKKEFRNRNIASRLVAELEIQALMLGVECLYLLTETASVYFERKGYEKISREQVPELIKASSEFSSVCPVSAIIMKKSIKAYA